MTMQDRPSDDDPGAMTSVGLTGADVTGADVTSSVATGEDAVAAADPDARAPGRRAALLARLYELMRFGMVGGVAFVVDTGLFNLLRFGPGDLLEAKPITAKIISVAVATVVSWLGNRFWTFSDRRTETHLREFAGFVVVNIGGMAIAIASLGVSHYVLDLRSPLADNISANGVGLVLGMVFRYYAYRTWVFTADPEGALPER